MQPPESAALSPLLEIKAAGSAAPPALLKRRPGGIDATESAVLSARQGDQGMGSVALLALPKDSLDPSHAKMLEKA